MNTASVEQTLRVRRAVRSVLTALDLLVVVAIVVVLATTPGRRLARPQRATLRALDDVLLVYFVAAAALRVTLAMWRPRSLGRRWYDALAIVALADALTGGKAAWPWFLVRQGLAGLAALVRSHTVRKLVRRLWLHPAPLLVGSFASAILIGTGLLALPIASTTSRSIGFLNALFTSTSAVCVTGLTVLETGKDFTLFGQLVILTLIQLGGLGIMTFAVSMAMIVGQVLSTTHGVALRSMLDQETEREATTLVRLIAVSTFIIEAIGAVALFLCFAPREGYGLRCAYLAIFHSISAFCNAGFSLYGRSFEGYCGHVGLNVTITSLIILGGLGFPVLRDLLIIGRRRRLGEGRSPRLRTQTKTVLTTSAVLVLGGAFFFYVLELPSTLKPLGQGERILASYFQSVTARTAGFNTVDISAVKAPALVVLMCLMFVGASPGSTGGGIKTTTAAILFQAMRSAFRRRPEVELFGRTVPRSTIRRSIALATLSLLLLTVTTVLIASVEPDKPFEKLLFEQVSAFGTVGLSAGITTALSVPGKLIIILLMFAGRVGPLTLTFSILGEGRPTRYRFPDTHIMVG